MPFEASAPARPTFRFPGADARTTIIGATGTGKTTAGFWLLSHMRFDKRPWIIFDFKGEELVDLVGIPPIQELRIGRVPKRPGLYVVSARPGDEDAVEDYLWAIWERGNIGLFIDECALLPHEHAWKAILRQGRSKRLPVIACTQRPVDVDRETFTEASYFAVFRMQDVRDYKTIQGFTNQELVATRLPQRYFWWYDVAGNAMFRMRPVPDPDEICTRIRRSVPYNWYLGG